MSGGMEMVLMVCGGCGAVYLRPAYCVGDECGATYRLRATWDREECIDPCEGKLERYPAAVPQPEEPRP